jgi:4'-phosphopantetheinyl transferase EntD
MGLDFESIDEANTHAMKSQMTSDELGAFLDSMESDITSLTVMWSAKEALSKILMCGLTCPFEILAISSLCPNADYYEGEYLNFKQYKFQSWVTETTVCTVAFPRRTQIETDMKSFLAELT